MNIPDGWIAAIGAAFAGAMVFLSKFVQKHLDRYIAGLREEIAELKEKQDKCEETTINLTDRVAHMEGERDGFLAGVDYKAEERDKRIAEAVAERLSER